MILISDSAATKIKSLMAKQGITDGGLRVGVKGGGCSGLSYTFGWEREPRLGDEVFEGPDGAKVFIDRKSYLFLNGTTLDYDTALLTQGVLAAFIRDGHLARHIRKTRTIYDERRRAFLEEAQVQDRAVGFVESRERDKHAAAHLPVKRVSVRRLDR